METEEVRNDLFNKLTELVTKHGLTASDIFNVDETGLQIVTKNPKIVSTKGDKQVFVRKAAERSETISIAVRGNANGTVILPPFIIFKGISLSNDLNASYYPDDSIFTHTKSGYMVTELFEVWFDEFLRRAPSKRPLLLLLDGHVSHASLAVIKKARENGVILLCIPPHTSQLFQRMDVGVFSSLKASFQSAAASRCKKLGKARITKRNFGKILKEAWEEGITPKNMKAGFRGSGIWPINKDAAPRPDKKKPNQSSGNLTMGSVASDSSVRDSTLGAVTSNSSSLDDSSPRTETSSPRTETSAPQTETPMPQVETSATLDFTKAEFSTPVNSLAQPASNCPISVADVIREMFKTSPRKPAPQISRRIVVAPCLTSDEYMKVLQDQEKTEKKKDGDDDSFLGITCHFFIDEQDHDECSPKLFSTTLDVIPILKDEKSQTLADLIKDTLLEWSILNKLKAVVTDNAANMKAVVELLPGSVKHFPCFAHTLDLVVKNGVNKDVVVQNVISKVKDLVTFFHHSPKAERILEGHNSALLEPGEHMPIKLVQSVDTRWNSVVAMLSSFIENWNGIKQVSLHDEYRNSFDLLSSAEIDIVKEVIIILESFESLTEDISGENYVTMSLIVPSITGLYIQFNEIEKNLKLGESKNFLNEVRRLVKEKLDLYEDRTMCRVSTLLDPRYKKSGFRTIGVDEGVKVIQVEIKKLINEPTAPVPPPQQTSSHSQINKKSKKSALDYVPEADPIVSNSSADAIVLTRNYLSAPKLPRKASTHEVLSHLKNQHPEIFQTAIQYLGVPGSSVPCERLFSSTGNLITDKRNRLSRENMAVLTFLHYNYKLLDN